MPVPVYSVRLYEAQGLGIGLQHIGVDELNVRIVRNMQVFAGLGGTFNLRNQLGGTVLWALIEPPNLFWEYDQEHLVIPPGDDWTVDCFPIGTMDVAIYGYSLSPP